MSDTLTCLQLALVEGIGVPYLLLQGGALRRCCFLDLHARTRHIQILQRHARTPDYLRNFLPQGAAP